MHNRLTAESCRLSLCWKSALGLATILTFRDVTDSESASNGIQHFFHNLDADFMCKIRRMRICRTIKISTGYYSYCDSLYYLKLQLQTN